MTDHDVIRALSLVEGHAVVPRDRNERAALMHALELLRRVRVPRTDEVDE